MSSGPPALESVRLFSGVFGRWLGLLPLLLGAVTPVLVVLGILSAGAPFPFEDHWDMVPLLERDATGTLTLGDLWAQQNEHRYVIPWVIMLGLARVTRWNILAELMLNVAFSLAAVALLALLVRRTCRERAPALIPWLVLCASLMTFSLVKWENWLKSMSQPAFLSALAACVTVFVLARRGPTPAGAVLAMLAAGAGVLSFANGLILLVVVPVAIALDPRAAAARRAWLALSTLALGVGVTALYLTGFEHPPKHPSPSLFLGHPGDFGVYLLAYLGAPLGWPALGPSIAWGLAGLVALGAASWWLWFRVPASRADVLPWLMLTLYVLGSAAMTGAGRLGAGVSQALASRYTTISTFHWIGVAVVAALATVSLIDTRRLSSRVRVATLAVAIVALVAASASYAAVWVRTNPWVEALEWINGWALECVQHYRDAPDGCLGVIHTDAGLVRQRAAQLDRLALGPFRGRSALASLASYTVVEPHEPAGAITAAWHRPISVRAFGGSQTYRSTEFWLAGWAEDPATRGFPTAVLVAADGVVLGQAPIAEDAQPAAVEPRHAGWAFRFSAFRLPPGARTLDAYAVLDGGRIARLAGSRRLGGTLVP
ncbi:MAG: hypothetical protein HYU51_08985 [Candidatus Rokubacteria bacterium]|nr:hypothetical protein [Candidatus Rokubacteria bacterium]